MLFERREKENSRFPILVDRLLLWNGQVSHPWHESQDVAKTPVDICLVFSDNHINARCEAPQLPLSIRSETARSFSLSVIPLVATKPERLTSIIKRLRRRSSTAVDRHEDAASDPCSRKDVGSGSGSQSIVKIYPIIHRLAELPRIFPWSSARPPEELQTIAWQRHPKGCRYDKESAITYIYGWENYPRASETCFDGACT